MGCKRYDGCIICVLFQISWQLQIQIVKNRILSDSLLGNKLYTWRTFTYTKSGCRWRLRPKLDLKTHWIRQHGCSSLLMLLSADNIFKKLGPRSGPDKMSGLIWIQTVWHSYGIPERIFQKKVIFRKISRRQKSMQIYPVGKELLKPFAHIQ